ncbi:hypothetical protein [Arthrobacter sp. 31Y]|uniref:hypothetical protein n=1 Tax=Arthrobacter sp. 31Y TaxID=1115632 RepID=UPI00046551C2|nr:hypothetical protein [Arthrobacter sp. 31Y]
MSDPVEMTAGADTLAWDIFRADNANIPEDELRAGFPAEAEYAINIAKQLRAAGYLRAAPVFEETLTNDGTHELTISSDCDGSNVVYWKRTPKMVAEIPASPWFAIGEGQA